MQQNNSDLFREVIENVYSFYGRDTSPFALDIWWLAMKPFDLIAVREALGRHCVNPDNGQWLPKPADVVKLMEGSSSDSAVAAWTKLEHTVRSVGTYETVVFDDPLIHRVVADMGGYTLFSSKTDDEWPFVQKEFVARYRNYKTRGTLNEFPPKLIGRLDHENLQHGFAARDPLLIGETEKASEVLRLGTTSPLLQVTRLKERSDRWLAIEEKPTEQQTIQ